MKGWYASKQFGKNYDWVIPLLYILFIEVLHFVVKKLTGTSLHKMLNSKKKTWVLPSQIFVSWWNDMIIWKLHIFKNFQKMWSLFYKVYLVEKWSHFLYSYVCVWINHSTNQKIIWGEAIYKYLSLYANPPYLLFPHYLLILSLDYYWYYLLQMQKLF